MRALIAMALFALASDPHIDIHSADEVKAKRAALIRYIWGTQWPDVLAAQPDRTEPYTPTAADGLPDVPEAQRIERVSTVVSLEAAEAGRIITHTSTAYIFHPHLPNGRLVIVHAGHNCAFDGRDRPADKSYNLDATLRQLVASHYAVAALRMPLYQSPSQCGADETSKSHDEMFNDPRQQLRRGSPVQFFLDPVARLLNYVEQRYRGTYNSFDMIGLSGGGWTTTLYAAIDPRIALSFPVAGSLPLDVAELRDSEQRIEGLYSIAGYKDLYLLGSFGAHRRQTQILNERDDCCFRPESVAFVAYGCEIQTRLSQLGAGSFVAYADASAKAHQISLAALRDVIIPTLNSRADGPIPGSCR